MRHFLLLLALLACASVPVDQRPRAVQDMERCLRTGPCTVLQVDNQQHDQATIYIDGTRFDAVEGHTERPLFIPDSRMNGDRCLSLTIKFLSDWRVVRPERACLPRGGYFALVLPNPLSASVLVPWAR